MTMFVNKVFRLEFICLILKFARNGIPRVSNFCIVISFWYEQDIQTGQNIGKNVIGPLKSGIITNMDDYGDKMSDTGLGAKVSLLSVVEDH